MYESHINFALFLFYFFLGISICCEVSGHVATLPGAKVVPASNLKPSTGCLVHALGQNEGEAPDVRFKMYSTKSKKKERKKNVTPCHIIPNYIFK